jgi:hypothetical protein
MLGTLLLLLLPLLFHFWVLLCNCCYRHRVPVSAWHHKISGGTLARALVEATTSGLRHAATTPRYENRPALACSFIQYERPI